MSWHARALRQLVFEKDNQIVCVPFPPAYDGVKLTALLKERGVSGLTPKEVYLDPEESLEDNFDLRRVLTDAIGPFSNLQVWGGLESSSIKQDVLLQTGISLRYLRGMAKIAFHYYLATSSVHSGGELLFQPVRAFIREGKGDWQAFVVMTVPHFIGELAEGKAPEFFSHFFGCRKVHGQINVALQFFVGPEHVTPPSMVLLGVTSRLLADQVHWVGYYGEKIEGYDGEIRDVLRPNAG